MNRQKEKMIICTTCNKCKGSDYHLVLDDTFKVGEILKVSMCPITNNCNSKNVIITDIYTTNMRVIN